MDNFSRRQNMVLGYSPQTSFENPRASSDAVSTKSSVDFDDVFGGPPKRASLHERLYRNNSEETVLSRSSSEKPVFGEDSVTRRRLPSDDFFDDIFNGDDSPSRPFTPRAEPSASSLPSQSSLPAKMTKAMEHPAYASTSLFGTIDQDELRNDVKSSYRQSHLSHEFSFRSRESIKVVDSDEKDVVSNLKQDFKVADVPSSPSQFHFSIYTWPGIGLPLVMPLRRRSTPKGKDKIDIPSSYSHISTSKVHDADSVLLNHGTSTSTESLKMKSEKKDIASDLRGQGYERKENVVQKENANASVGKNVNNIKETRTESSRVEVKKAAVQSTPEENLRTSGAKGKVKEFVGAFKQGTSSKPKISGNASSHSSRQKDAEESVRTKKVDKKIHIPTSASVNENTEQSRKQYPRTESSFHTSVGNSSGPREASSFSKTKPPVSKATMDNLDDLFQDDFVIKELPNDQGKTSDSGQEEKDAIRAWDAKVQQWSYGKKGNIRSLLSTLQFVLWTGSGWKPVPLVDVIEGNAVKKAYQRALLCLHPDKLQQKGAGSDQKYIAEKVFDILQEAWDQFNAMGAL